MAGLRIAAVGLLLAGLAVPAQAGPRRNGKTVRVERRRLAAAVPVHLCILQSPGQDHLLCLGKLGPVAGDQISMISLSMGGSGTEAVQVVEVVGSRPADEDTCHTGRLHAVEFRSPAGGSGMMLGYTGLSLSASARYGEPPAPPPALLAGESMLPLTVVDAFGTGTALVATQRDCHGQLGGAAADRTGCIRYWRADGGDWTTVGEDLYAECR